MALVKVKTKYQVTLPTAIRKQMNIQEGDILAVEIFENKILLSPKSIIDKAIAEGLADIEAGRVHGPFNSVAEAIQALHAD